MQKFAKCQSRAHIPDPRRGEFPDKLLRLISTTNLEDECMWPGPANS